MCQMRVLGAGMFVLKSFDSDCFTLDNNYSGFDPDTELEYTIPTSHPLISYLCETNQAYTIDELESNQDSLVKTNFIAKSIFGSSFKTKKSPKRSSFIR